MNKFKYLLAVLLCLTMLLCSSCIYATDMNENATDIDNLQVDETATDTLALEKNTNDDMGSLDELDSIIQNLKPGEVCNIEKNYHFNDADTTGRCISISTDNITINGNGHHFDGNNNAVTFKITGKNVNIFNFGIHNCQGYGQKMTITIDGNPTTYSTDMSPVFWQGANGTMSNCYLIKNSAINGGALTWTGENGIINNTVFMNNTAKGVGGAIYLDGENTTIANALFLNSTSRLLNESIYLDSKQNSFNLDSIVCEGLFYIDGNAIGVDSDNLRKSYGAQFGGEKIDLIPIIYSSLFSINKLDDNIYYYGQFSNETHTFTLVLIKNFDEYSITYENEYVIQTKSMDEIFAGLASNFYTINTKIIKTVNVNTIEEHNAVCHSNIDKDIPKTEVMNIITNDIANIHNFKGITYILNVDYKNNTCFASNEQWDENTGYDLITIEGNGATIHALAEENDEYHWIVNTKNETFVISNLTIEGFNTAIRNINGTCLFIDVTFNRNRLDYYFEKDEGGAIINAGIISCANCTFTNNHAKNGGAIFSQGLLILENCTFENNEGYGTGNDVLNVDQGIVILNGNNTPVDPTTYVESISSIKTELITFFCSVMVIGLTLVATGLAFLVTGNPVAALCVGVGVGAALGTAFGLWGGYIIASHQYNLDYDRKATVFGFTTEMVSLGVQTAFAYSMHLEFKTYAEKQQKMAQYKTNEKGKSCVLIGKEYYEIGEEAIYIKGNWVKKSDCVAINGIYYFESETVEINGIRVPEKDCEYVTDAEGKSDWHLRSDCIKHDNIYYLKKDCCIINGKYYPKSLVSKVGNSYFLKNVHNDESVLIYEEKIIVEPQKPIEMEFGEYRKVIPAGSFRERYIFDIAEKFLEFNDKHEIIGWSQKEYAGNKIERVFFSPWSVTAPKDVWLGGMVTIYYTTASGENMAITLTFNQKCELLRWNTYERHL